ncbi:ribonuclease H-like domain-containing protein [Candidatus Woesearchaeota archaeon]|nr:ribonuclease H-like domain-containing protein [Candidatus Woesearchaeota archaeon]
MLTSTFIHVPRVGAHVEKQLWEHGIRTWDDFLQRYDELPLTERKKEQMRVCLLESQKHLLDKNHRFFSSMLPLNAHWRAFKEFEHSVCYLDIETTGLDKRRDEITVLGLYDGEQSRIYVQGKDLDDFAKDIQKYSIIVTFNGRCFDVPFIQSKYPELQLNHLHIDLRFVMKNLGYTGGLKRIERELAISRSDEIEGVDGFEAVRLWYKYRRGDESALRKLIAYNEADIVNLKTMMEFAYDRSIRQLKI